MLTTPLGRFRAVAFLEGVSFLLLLFIAMPLKYGFGMPQFVRVVGMAHGVLVFAYLYVLLMAALEHRWSVGKCATAFVSSLVPGGTFWFDARLRREEQAAAAALATQQVR
jgi:integral membrane protein